MIKNNTKVVDEPHNVKYILKSQKFNSRRYICLNDKLGQGAFSRVYKGYVCDCKSTLSNGFFECEDINECISNESLKESKRVEKRSQSNKIGEDCKCDMEIVKFVAIKKMHLTKVKSRKVLENEIEVMQKLNNPYIVNLIDVVYDTDKDQTIYIILEYCGGRDLKNYIGNRRLKEKYAKLFFHQIAQGLQYLHSKNIIHRDLKPQNILLNTGKKSLKIADFGFAKIIGSESLAETMCGSPMYMAPEVIKGKPYTSKADLWSVGIMMYEAITGFHPFQGANSIYDLIEKIERQSKKNQIKFPANMELSWYARDLLKRLLRANPDERIEWKEFFAHKFFVDESQSIENFNGNNREFLNRSIALSPPSFISPTVPLPKTNNINMRIINDYSNDLNNQNNTKSVSVPVRFDQFECDFDVINETNSSTEHKKPTKAVSYIADYLGSGWNLLKDSLKASNIEH